MRKSLWLFLIPAPILGSDANYFHLGDFLMKSEAVIEVKQDIPKFLEYLLTTMADIHKEKDSNKVRDLVQRSGLDYMSLMSKEDVPIFIANSVSLKKKKLQFLDFYLFWFEKKCFKHLIKVVSNYLIRKYQPF